MVHDRIADQDHLEHLAAVERAPAVVISRPVVGGAPIGCLVDQLTDQFVEGRPDRVGQLGPTVWVHHDVGDPAHEILTEADLGVHAAGAGQDLPGRQVAEVAGHRGRADVDGHAEGPVDETGPGGSDRPAPVRARSTDGNGERSVGGGPVEVGQDRGLEPDPIDGPVGRELVGDPFGLAGAVLLGPRGQLEVVEADDGVDDEAVEGHVLAHHLPMDLARRRHVDDHIAQYPGVAPEPTALGQGLPAEIGGLDLAGGAQVTLVGGDGPLVEPAGGRLDLAATADPSSAAHRVEVDPEAPGCGQGRDPVVDAAAQTRWCEHHPVPLPVVVSNGDGGIVGWPGPVGGWPRHPPLSLRSGPVGPADRPAVVVGRRRPRPRGLHRPGPGWLRSRPRSSDPGWPARRPPSPPGGPRCASGS